MWRNYFLPICGTYVYLFLNLPPCVPPQPLVFLWIGMGRLFVWLPMVFRGCFCCACIYGNACLCPPICGMLTGEQVFFLCQPFPQIARVFHNFRIVIHRFRGEDQKNGRYWQKTAVFHIDNTPISGLDPRKSARNRIDLPLFPIVPVWLRHPSP